MTATITELGQSEKWFWETEPRIVINLIEQKKEIDTEKMKTQSAFIACCVWGEDMEKIAPTKKRTKEKVLGVDTPVNPQLLRGFYG